METNNSNDNKNDKSEQQQPQQLHQGGMLPICSDAREREEQLANVTIVETSSLFEAMKAINLNRMKIVFVVNNEGALMASLSDGDIRRAILSGHSVHDSVTVAMNRSCIFLTTSSKDRKKTTTTTEELPSALQLHPVHYLPVPVIDSVTRRIVDLLCARVGTSVLLSEIQRQKEPLKGINDRRYETTMTTNQTTVSNNSNNDNDNSLSSSSALELSRNPPYHPATDVRKVLVIGGAGYIGSVLVRMLLSHGYSVRVLDSFYYSKDSLRDVADGKLGPIEIVKGDTRHLETLTSCCEGVDAVVHLAELVGDPACAFNPKMTQDINYLATVSIAQACKHYQINRFIYVSSCSVYGSCSASELLTEESPLSPVSLYAKLKIEAERSLLGLAASGDNFSPTILRLATVFGESFRPRFDLVVNTMTATALLERSIKVFGGDQWRPHVHVSDVSRAITTCLEAPIDRVARQVFNVGSEKNNMTISELGRLVKEEIPEAELSIDETAKDLRNYRVSCKKIEQTLGFTAIKSVRDGVREIKEVLLSGKVENPFAPVYSNYLSIESLAASEKKQISI